MNKENFQDWLILHLANQTAKRRTMGSVYMDGSHNPHAGELHHARQMARDIMYFLEMEGVFDQGEQQ